jgi:hypothetical protein
LFQDLSISGDLSQKSMNLKIHEFAVAVGTTNPATGWPGCEAAGNRWLDQ